MLLGVLALRFAFYADEDHSWFLGRSFGSACWFRIRFGIPCPNCGMTRSLILAAHGEFLRAWQLAPGGLAMVAAAVLSGVALGVFGATMLWGKPRTTERWQRALRVTILMCAGLATMIWLGGWAVAVNASLRSR